MGWGAESFLQRLKTSRLVRLVRVHGLLLAAVASIGAVEITSADRGVDNAIAAWRMQVVRRAPSNSLVVVELDTPSLNADPVWPWPRSRYARVIRNLRAAGATVIGFDVDFSARSSPAEDAEMQSIAAAEPGSLVLPTFVQTRGERFENTPFQGMAQNAVLASVNIPVDADGVVRHYWRAVPRGDHYEASMAATLAGATYRDNSAFVIDYGINIDAIPRLSFDDVLNNRFNPAAVRGKAILIGATALELGDEFATPHTPSEPGVFIHALAYESIYQNRSLAETNGLVGFVLALAALAFLWPRTKQRPLRAEAARHLLILGAALFVPVVVQAVAPVSLRTSIVLLAQALAIWRAVQRELEVRAEQILSEREAHLRHAALHDLQS